MREKKDRPTKNWSNCFSMSRDRAVKITHFTDICRDSDDNKFLELAVSGKARFVITGDQDLLVLEAYEGTEIITPATFLEQTDDLA